MLINKTDKNIFHKKEKIGYNSEKIQWNIFLEKYSKGIAKYLGENANTIVREIGVADYAKGYGEKIIRK